MRIALTGATGLIGHAIAANLGAAGHTVIRLGRGEGQDVRFDLARDAALPPGVLRGCDALVHAAGVVDEDFTDRVRAFAKALVGAEALLRAAAEGRVARLVYVSSAHVYGPLEGDIDESRAPNPLSDYAIAHYATEQLFRRAASHASVLLVRPCAVYGMPPDLARFARWSLIPFDFPRQALAGSIVLKSHGTQRRNFVPADGLAACIASWLASPPPGPTLANTPGESEMSVYDFALLCARIAAEESGRHCEVRRAPAPEEEPAPLVFRSRFTGPLAGIGLENHVHAVVRALAKEKRT